MYLVRRPEPLREPVEPNALFIVNAEDVIVFEGGGAPDLIEDWTAQQSKGELAARRAELLPDLHLMRDEFARVTVVPPDLLVSDRLVLERKDRQIHILHLGRGNTPGDLVLWLPNERILAGGDLVVHPIPYGFGSFPGDWIATLERLAAFDFEVLVPGHGELQRDRGYLRRLQAMLTEVRRQVGDSVEAGHDLETTRNELDLAAFEQEFAGDDPDRQLKFNNWWKLPIARSAWLEARGEEIRQGASDETG